MTVHQDITVICPRNDLESVTILSLARDIRMDVRVSQQDRGGKLGNEPADNLLSLKKTVVVIELPDPSAEERLRHQGHEVIVIDHHDYPGLNRWRPESSLEQFYHLAGQPMTDDVWEVAVNDRDFIPGLARLGLSYEKMEDIRRREWDARGISQLCQEAFEKLRFPLRSFEDLDLFLVPNQYSPVMGEVAQWPSEDDYAKGVRKGLLRLRNCLILYHEEGKPDCITIVEFWGDGSFQEAFKGLLEDRSFADFEMWAGGGEYNCFWGAKPKHSGANPQTLDELIDRVLSFTLVWERPLRRFSTTFLFPFRFEGNAAPKVDGRLQPKSYSSDEVLYFLPQVRQFFFEGGFSAESGVQGWTLPVKEGEDLSIYEKEGSEPINVSIKEISLYRFFNGIHILSISTAQDTDSSFWEWQPLWKALAAPSFESKCVTLTPTQALVFNNLARIIYSSYPEQLGEGKVAKKVVWGRNGQIISMASYREGPQDVSEVVMAMIGNFVGPNKEIDRDFLWDDRMFVHTCLVFSGSRPRHAVAEDSYHALFTLATYVDKSGFDHLGGYAYDREFIKREAEQLTNRRWYEVSGNLYSFTRLSAVFFGFEKFSHEIVARHVLTMYLRMSIIALFYRTSLLYYGYRVAQLPQPSSHKATDKAIRRYQEELRDVHWELARFTNKYWFVELSSQDQGIEQFNLQTAAMGLKEQYDRVKGDIERAYTVLETRSQSVLSWWSSWVAIVALVFTILFLIIGFFGTDFGIIPSHVRVWVVAGLVAFASILGGIFIGRIVPKLRRR